MMRINGFSGTNTQTGAMGMVQAGDSVSRNIQNQIANAQQKLQDLSSNKEMSLEDKMKKRQEIQQEINNLNQQLRQHQIEQRSKQQSKNSSSMDDMMAGTNSTSAKKGTGLSQASMQAMISADSSVKQAKVQSSTATQLEGRAGVLESEIKQDKGSGANTGKKEEELADLQVKAQSATAAHMSTLADANKTMEEAAKDGYEEVSENQEAVAGEDAETEETASEEYEENEGDEAVSEEALQEDGSLQKDDSAYEEVEETAAPYGTEAASAADPSLSEDDEWLYSKPRRFAKKPANEQKN